MKRVNQISCDSICYSVFPSFFFVFFWIKKVNCSCFIFYSVAAPLIEKDNILRVMQNACLVLHVYCEKLKKNSFWKPYLGILYTEQRKSCVCVLLHHSFTVVSIQSMIWLSTLIEHKKM